MISRWYCTYIGSATPSMLKYVSLILGAMMLWLFLLEESAKEGSARQGERKIRIQRYLLKDCENRPASILVPNLKDSILFLVGCGGGEAFRRWSKNGCLMWKMYVYVFNPVSPATDTYILFRPTFHAQQPSYTKLHSCKSIIHERP